MWFFWSHDRKRAENSTLSSPCACHYFIVRLLSGLTVVCFLETNSYWALFWKNFFKTNIIKTLCAPGRCDLSPEMGLFWKNAFAELCSRTGDRKTGWLTLVNGYWAGGFKEPVEGSLRVLSEEKRSHETDETLFVLTSDWEHRLSKCYKYTAVWS